MRLLVLGGTHHVGRVTVEVGPHRPPRYHRRPAALLAPSTHAAD